MEQDIVLNCQGLPCPQPVIQLKKMLTDKSPLSVEVIVDNEPALENVSRFLFSQGYTFSHSKKGSLWVLQANKDTGRQNTGSANAGQQELVSTAGKNKGTSGAKTLILLLSPVVGAGDDALGEKLLKNFISTLSEMGPDLWRIVMLNGGVRLATKGSLVLDELQNLEKNGVRILVCGTCLEHFGLLAQKVVGETTNMLDVVTSMHLADKVIRM